MKQYLKGTLRIQVSTDCIRPLSAIVMGETAESQGDGVVAKHFGDQASIPTPAPMGKVQGNDLSKVFSR